MRSSVDAYALCGTGPRPRLWVRQGALQAVYCGAKLQGRENAKRKKMVKLCGRAMIFRAAPVQIFMNTSEFCPQDPLATPNGSSRDMILPGHSCKGGDV